MVSHYGACWQQGESNGEIVWSFADFSYNPTDRSGCCKVSQSPGISNAPYDGYRKAGWVPPAPPGGCVLATVWSKFASHAIVAVANFCGAAVDVALAVDWAALGLDAATAAASLPSIDGVQVARALPSPSGPFTLDTDGGVLMLIAAPAFESQSP